MMQDTADSPRYTHTAMALHWLLAVLIVGNFALGLTMHELPFSMTRLKLYNWHKWAGVGTLALSTARLLWRLRHPPPPGTAMPAWQSRAAHAAHMTLYGLFFAAPLAGWAYSSAAGFPIVLFGVLPLPDFVPVQRELSEVLKQVHAALAMALAAVVVVHVAGAVKHQWISRDGLLQRMLPALR